MLVSSIYIVVREQSRSIPTLLLEGRLARRGQEIPETLQEYRQSRSARHHLTGETRCRHSLYDISRGHPKQEFRNAKENQMREERKKSRKDRR